MLSALTGWRWHLGCGDVAASQEMPLYLGSTLDNIPSKHIPSPSPSSVCSGLTLDMEMDDLLSLV